MRYHHYEHTISSFGRHVSLFHEPGVGKESMKPTKSNAPDDHGLSETMKTKTEKVPQEVAKINT
jgi:hypothetical protein